MAVGRSRRGRPSHLYESGGRDKKLKEAARRRKSKSFE